MGFSRQEYWSGLPFTSAGDLPDPGIKPRSPALQAGSLPTELQGKPAIYIHTHTHTYTQLSHLLAMELEGEISMSDSTERDDRKM